MTWTSPSIPYLTSEKSPIPLTKEQSDIISSLLTVGYITGYIMNPFVIEKFGSKRTLLIYTIPQMAAWILINLSKTPITLYIARVFAGMGYGAGICALTIYLSEIGTSKTRGIFISYLNLAMGFGFFLVMLFGAYIPYEYMNLILLTFPIIFAITFIFMPDASYFHNEENENGEMKIKLNSSEKEDLITHEMKELNISQRNEISENNFPKSDTEIELNPKEYSKLDIDPNREFDKQNFNNDLINNPNYKLRENFDSEEKLKADRNSKEDDESDFFNFKKSRFWKMITTQNSRKALIITISLAAQDVLSGHMVVWTFTQQLLTSKESPIDSEKATMFLALAKIIASGISAQIIEKTNRRNILFVTSIIGIIANIVLCVFFFMEEGNYDISMFTWLPCVGLTCYELFLSIGCANFFYVYQAELFTSDVKSLGVMVCKVSYMALSYFCLFRFQVLMAAIGRAMIYLIFSIFSIIVSIFVLSITPETRGKTNNEIQMILKKKKFFV
ncbi:uncharacterized protein LOC127291275 isoform X2 [Leptopilina boulardi]|nr:uncharacterized protein LOC127291275 isoform X2 [Leptopilina boulardi]XP_051176282.1 uncharacterized protein LOC127291275 isoform X2 [Leptopilina boulardi]XP_051176283.1 uncharacterized protein LOC127291275 isoform X2 [Leptopilina boulardi]